MPELFAVAEESIFDPTTVVIQIDDGPGVNDGTIGQIDAWLILEVLVAPHTDDDRMQGRTVLMTQMPTRLPSFAA